MVPIILIVILILLLRNLSSSNKASRIQTKNVTVASSCGSAGDNFVCGSTPIAGVCEKPTPIFPRPAAPQRIHCCHIVVGTFSGLPVHVTYPVAPPPIKIQTPVYNRPAPLPVRPILGGGSFPVRTPLMQSGFCCAAIGGGGMICLGGGGGGGFTCDYPKMSVY